VANRGEIALRVIRACREMGIEAVAVFSQADAGARYLELADEAICIGPAAPAQSYLNIARIISAAEVADVDAIHPGYGFLAENPHFAEVCRSCNIEFIGPSVEAMRAVGDKVTARHIARQAKIYTIPGSEEPLESEDETLTLAHKLGYPVMVKAVAGGGGRGMRIAHNDISLTQAVRQGRTEAEAAFSDGRVYLEKCIEGARHVEVQVLADTRGNTVYLWERDCTLQRRHQKLIEESPSPAIGRRTREKLCDAAVRMAREAGYTGAGTVEFLVDPKETFYLLEVNARIQVEHPVTELVTGIDLVEQQIRVAAGERLPFRQKDVLQKGCAIECRINAEDPDHGFRPSPGRVEAFVAPGGPGVRWDSHVYQGYEIPSAYDSLVGKLIVHRPTRDEAIAVARRALDEFVIVPTKTTIPLCREILSHEKFVRGQWDTTFVEREILTKP
ncbi:MAG: acetyl-CoA carboxylase biotin carboxylase subunit, partial [Candidatus Brocadiae bacterium]|nr:acetyl-CoA carboxylase biotin carboxylase subunit [Candidatus Brocadiia bacterium]